MKAEEGLAFLVVVVVAVIVLAAVMPDTFWTSGRGVDTVQVAQDRLVGQTFAVAMPPAGGGANQPGLWALSQPQVIPVAAPRDGNNTAAVDQPVPQPGGTFNFERAPRVQFYGKIQQITEVQQNDGQVHVWIHDPAGGEMQISVAPSWFLKFVNCSLNHDVTITGSGFRFDRKNRDALVYAQKIQVNGHVCHLRNDEGFALWSNKLR